MGTVDAASSVWSTAPVGGPPGQPDYLNAVVRWRPSRAWATPARALAALLAIEAGSGRQRRVRWGPRTLDLDLLDGEGWAPDTRSGRGVQPRLPHPRAAARAFVLAPWAEIAPAWPAPPEDGAVPGVRTALATRPAATVSERAGAIDRTGVRPVAGAEAEVWRAAVAASVRSGPRPAPVQAGPAEDRG